MLSICRGELMVLGRIRFRMGGGELFVCLFVCRVCRWLVDVCAVLSRCLLVRLFFSGNERLLLP